MDESELKTNRAEFIKFGEHFERSLRPYLLGLEGERKMRFTIGLVIAIALIPIGLFLSLIHI